MQRCSHSAYLAEGALEGQGYNIFEALVGRAVVLAERSPDPDPDLPGLPGRHSRGA